MTECCHSVENSRVLSLSLSPFAPVRLNVTMHHGTADDAAGAPPVQPFTPPPPPPHFASPSVAPATPSPAAVPGSPLRSSDGSGSGTSLVDPAPPACQPKRAGTEGVALSANARDFVPTSAAPPPPPGAGGGSAPPGIWPAPRGGRGSHAAYPPAHHHHRGGDGFAPFYDPPGGYVAAPLGVPFGAYPPGGRGPLQPQYHEVLPRHDVYEGPPQPMYPHAGAYEGGGPPGYGDGSRPPPPPPSSAGAPYYSAGPYGHPYRPASVPTHYAPPPPPNGGHYAHHPHHHHHAAAYPYGGGYPPQQQYHGAPRDAHYRGGGGGHGPGGGGHGPGGGGGFEQRRPHGPPRGAATQYVRPPPGTKQGPTGTLTPIPPHQLQAAVPARGADDDAARVSPEVAEYLKIVIPWCHWSPDPAESGGGQIVTNPSQRLLVQEPLVPDAGFPKTEDHVHSSLHTPAKFPHVQLHLVYYMCPQSSHLHADTIEGKLPSRSPDLKLGGICGDVSAWSIAHIIHVITQVKVIAIDMFNRSYGRCNLWLEDPEVAPALIQRIDRRMWMAPLSHGYAVVCTDDPSREFLFAYLENLRKNGPRKVFFPRHLVTADRWNP